MKIRQYSAPTISEALRRIRLDLGPDAVILHQRTFKKGGFLGLFGKEVVEVLAAADHPAAPAAAPLAAPPAPSPRQAAVPRPQFPTELRHSVPQGGIGPWDAPVPAEPEAFESSDPGAESPAGSLAPKVDAKLAETVRAAVRSELSGPLAQCVSQAVEDALGSVSQKVEAAVVRLESAVPTNRAWSGAQQRIYDQLMRKDLDPALGRQILARLHAMGAQEEGALQQQLPDALAAFVRVAGGIGKIDSSQRPKVVVLVGPTGVGKTTTIAKLAATARLSRQQSVGLVTIDTYRIAAVEQLKTYGDIIGIPVEVVMTPGSLKEALERLKEKDLVLVDTAGRSPSHRLHLNELRTFIEAIPDPEVHLVLASTNTRANLAKAIESFSQVGVDRLLFTKVDEAATLGAVVSVATNASRPISYLTNGQSVPDDLAEASALDLAKLVIAT